MDFTRRHLLQSTSAAALSSTLGPLARAQNTGAGPVASLKIVNGGVPQSIAEPFSQKIAQSVLRKYANAVVVDTVTGGDGIGAIQTVKNAAPDGATLLQTPMSALAIYPLTYKQLPYDPVADLTPVSTGCFYDFGFAVGPAVPASVRTVQGFFTWCKANEAKASFGSTGLGSLPHFIGTLAARSADAPLKHAPYKTAQAAIEDLVAGKTAAVCLPVHDLTRAVAMSQCRLIATAGTKRSAFAGDTPTFWEQGFSSITFSEWVGFYFPAKTAPETVARMNAAIGDALQSPLAVAAIASIGVEPLHSTPEELAGKLKADSERWRTIAQSMGVKTPS